MDPKQLIVQRARDFFENRLEEASRMVRLEWQQLKNLEENRSGRALVQQIIREGTTAEPGAMPKAATEVMEYPARPAEFSTGQQREIQTRLLGDGASALEKIAASMTAELNAEEFLGLEYVLLHYGRPALLIRQGRLTQVPPFWTSLEEHREGIEMGQQGVGRIELVGHPEFDWAGTGFLVTETCLMTSRRTVEIFAENGDTGKWQFRPGISAWMDYRSLHRPGTMARYRVRRVLGTHAQYDLALLEVDPPARTAEAPCPLTLAGRAPANLDGRPVYLIGYPICDPRRNEPEFISRIFQEVYNVKRVQPGKLRGCKQFNGHDFLYHDCAMLGHSEGACLVDLETHQVVGMHLFGRYLEHGRAVPLWTLREDPLFKEWGICFADGQAQDLRETIGKLEQLAQSRFWADARAAINNLCQRALGEPEKEK